MAEKFAGDTERAEARRQQAQTKRKTKTKSVQAHKQQPPRKVAADKSRLPANATEDARRAAEQRSADEADMLARARREAEDRRAQDEQAQLAEEARRLIIEAERERANGEALLERERGRTAQERTQVAPSPNSDALRAEAAEAEARRAASQAAERERVRAAEEEKLALLRRDETRRLIDKLNRVRQIREARLAAQERVLAEQNRRDPPPSAPGVAPLPPAKTVTANGSESRPATGGPATSSPMPPSSEPRMALGGRERTADAPTERYSGLDSEGRVTVLLVMAPGSYGIRRNGPKVADPILCAAGGCYVSDGADRPARFLPGRKALGFGNTFGARAGACRQHLGCVFRGVELGRLPASLQPADLHILKHDLRRPREVAGDSACHTGSGHLVCDRGIYTQDYAMWIVPERMADAVGPVVLEEAVADGLKGPRSADIFSLLGR